MKYVCFSFDDARLDTYYNAYQIIRKYKLSATINVISDFVLHPEKYHEFKSANNKAMTVEQLRECQANGMEIACHGSTHKNTKEDILRNIEELKEMGIDVADIGFASPNSELTHKNYGEINELIFSKHISYIRSGIQIRREGMIYTFLSLLEQYSHSKSMFYFLNKKNILTTRGSKFMSSVAITKNTTVNQIMYLLENINDGDGVILMFHSVLEPDNEGYGEDKWYWDKKRFESLCQVLKSSNDIEVCLQKSFLEDRE